MGHQRHSRRSPTRHRCSLASPADPSRRRNAVEDHPGPIDRRTFLKAGGAALMVGTLAPYGL
ncbi:MAG: twin-arginine translocation signal domain-containing protein, partial [Actinobacteria bacterium]|nr:twin-arginine translocation signal domain-containing protein [Actinomycetota bacterium]